MHSMARIALGATLALVPTTALAGGADWIQDFDVAQRVAKKEGKDLLVDFTGSDWCGWCIRLDREVFSHASFLEAAKKDFVLVSLDFPRGDEAKEKVPNPERNQELLERHRVRGFPTVLLMNAEGEAYARTGYRQGGPTAYLAHLGELRAGGTRIAALVQEWRRAEGPQRADAWKGLVDELGRTPPDSPLAHRLATPVRAELARPDSDLDVPQRVRGLRALLDAGQVDSAVVELARGLDPSNEQGLRERAVYAFASTVDSRDAVRAAFDSIRALDDAGPIRDPEIALFLYANAADWNQRFLDDPAQAKEYARKAKALTDDPKVERMLQEILDA